MMIHRSDEHYLYFYYHAVIKDTDADVLLAVQEITNFLQPYNGYSIHFRSMLKISRGIKNFDTEELTATVDIRGAILLTSKLQYNEEVNYAHLWN